LCLWLVSVGLYAHAEIVKVAVSKTETFEQGKIFGKAGTYERIVGKVYGEVDPFHPGNIIIQDIQLAPRNARGKVEYVSDFIILRPTDMQKSNGLLFLSLPNRGNAFAADTALLNRGYIYFWCAWQGDVLEGNNRLLMQVPVATDHGKTITGQLRVEYQVAERTPTQNLSSCQFSGLSHASYETTSLDNRGLTLTKRVHEADKPIAVPNSDWAFSDSRTVPFPGTPDTRMISLKDGFDPNYLYELVYEAKDPLVLGLGFAAIRDMGSFLRTDAKDGVGNINPLTTPSGKNPVRAAVIQGVSQCSNFVRTFLQLGFNTDEKGHTVFDGANPHIATRRISLNVRFGRPGGAGLQHEDHLFPSNDPPFTWDRRHEPVSKITGGILEACMAKGNCPRIVQTVGSSEYWQLRASLTTTDSYGKQDLVIPQNVRIYYFAGTQHSPFSMQDRLSGFTTNGNGYYLYWRAMLIALERWVLEGKEPPASVYPTIAAKTLVKPDKASTGWPDIPGVPYTGMVNDVPLLDFGPGYNMAKVTGTLNDHPKVVKEHAYQTMVPKVDKDGNEVAGIRSVTLQVPLGTYTGWSLRQQGFGEGDMNALNGMFIPFRKTKAERIAANDPRLSLEERYGTHARYVEAVTRAASDLVKKGYLLPEDAAYEISRAENSNVLK